jgi:hypothetical protein
MADLAEIGADWLAVNVRQTRNSADLVQHLRDHGPVTPALAELLADVLEGKLKVRAKRRTVRDLPKWYLRERVAYFRRVLDADKADRQREVTWELIEPMLREAKLSTEVMTRGEATHAARVLAANSLGVTLSQFDEALSPRKARTKAR